MIHTAVAFLRGVQEIHKQGWAARHEDHSYKYSQGVSRVFNGPLERPVLSAIPRASAKRGYSRAKRVDTNAFSSVDHGKLSGHREYATLNGAGKSTDTGGRE